MAVRCAPPDNKPLPEEITRCLDHLEAEVAELHRVQVVVALGKIAFDVWLQLLNAGSPCYRRDRSSLTADSCGSRDLRGCRKSCLGCYHPSRQNTNTGKLTPG